MTSSTDDYGDTPATSPDPEAVAEGDSNQLPQEDTLLDRGVDSVLDEGYSPPERPPNPNRLETHLDQAIGETHDDKLAQEEPEAWEVEGLPSSAREPDRAGRLAAADSESTGLAADSVPAQDVGIAGGAATAEEAAMHVVDENEA